MKRTLKTLSLVFFMAVIVVLSSCIKANNQANVSLRVAFWGDVKEIEIIKKSVARFEKENPDIKVKLERLPAGDPYTEKILTMIAGGNPVDIMFCNAERFYNYAARGILLPLNDFVKKYNFPIDKFYKRIVQKFSIGDNLYVLPRDIAPVCVVFYNKHLFDEAGLAYPTNDWTWDDLVRYGQALTKKNPDGSMTFGFADD
ncbi:MAG TPA: extracellular solute-binding protein, partial [Candidatus Goldiibacteriota bacterium]|nr:extracellular solute-binding protein [Candidatus Goldiibacteriota bacterium]